MLGPKKSYNSSALNRKRFQKRFLAPAGVEKLREGKSPCCKTAFFLSVAENVLKKLTNHGSTYVQLDRRGYLRP